MSDKKLLAQRKQLKQKIRDYERAKERAEKLQVVAVRAENRNTDGRNNGDGRERREYHHREEREDEEERRRRPPPRRFQRPPPRDARRGRRGEEEERAREYDGPMDREEMMERRPNEWTRDKMRAKEKVEEKVFVPPPPKKLRTDDDGERRRGREEEEEDGEVKEEGEAPKKFVPPPGEMTMKAAPYVPPSRQKAKTWTRPAAPNRNRADGPKIPEIGSRGFTRQRSVSPGIHAKDLAPWTMSEPAKKPSDEEKEKPKNIPETIPEEKEIDVPLPPPRAQPISTKTEGEEKPSSPPKRKRTTRSKSPSSAPPPPPSRRSSRRSKSASVEPATTVVDDDDRKGEENKKAETSKRTVKELKELLASKGLSTDGLKADLVKRVEENASS